MPRYPQVKQNLPREGRGPLPQALLDRIETVNDGPRRGRPRARPAVRHGAARPGARRGRDAARGGSPLC